MQISHGKAWENWASANYRCTNAKLLLQAMEQEYQKLTNKIPNYNELELKISGNQINKITYLKE